MAPIKKPKKALKLVETTDKIKNKKSKKKNYQSFAIFLFRLLRTIVPADSNINISKKCMLIMDNFVNDTLERLAMEAGRLVVHSRKSVMTSREIQTAMRLLVPGELADHANIEGIKALNLYKKSRALDEKSK